MNCACHQLAGLGVALGIAVSAPAHSQEIPVERIYIVNGIVRDHFRACSFRTIATWQQEAEQHHQQFRAMAAAGDDSRALVHIVCATYADLRSRGLSDAQAADRIVLTDRDGHPL